MPAAGPFVEVHHWQRPNKRYDAERSPKRVEKLVRCAMEIPVIPVPRGDAVKLRSTPVLESMLVEGAHLLPSVCSRARSASPVAKVSRRLSKSSRSVTAALPSNARSAMEMTRIATTTSTRVKPERMVGWLVSGMQTQYGSTSQMAQSL